MQEIKEIDKERLTKCPLCKGDLYDYSLMGIKKTNQCYCPKCDIVRSSLLSMPFLCGKCYSRSFYEKDGKHYCWLCGNDKFISIKSDDAEKKGLFETEGFRLSGILIEKNESLCKHKYIIGKRHNDMIIKFICEDCGYTEYMMVPRWYQEDEDIKEEIKMR